MRHFLRVRVGYRHGEPEIPMKMNEYENKRGGGEMFPGNISIKSRGCSGNSAQVGVSLFVKYKNTAGCLFGVAESQDMEATFFRKKSTIFQ